MRFQRPELTSSASLISDATVAHLLLGYFPNLELKPVSRDILLEAAALRAHHRLRTPDAIA
jgi:hypothetical protein